MLLLKRTFPGIAGLLTLICCFHLDSSGQKQFSVSQYTSKNGLPQNSVKSMMMDHYGLLWMVTESGIVRFDGNHFKTFNTSNCSALINNRLSNIYKTSGNNLVVNDECGSLLLIRENRIIPVKKGNKNHADFFIDIKGGIPDVDTYEKMFGALYAGNKDALSWHTDPFFVYPVSANAYWVLGKNNKLLFYAGGKKQKEIEVLHTDIAKCFTVNNELYFINSRNVIYTVNEERNAVVECRLKGDILKDKNLGRSLLPANIFNKYGLNGTYIKMRSCLYLVERGTDPHELQATLLCNQLPGNCIINDVFFHPYYRVLYIGTDTKGLFICKEENIRTLVHNSNQERDNNAYYAQLAIDSSHTLTTDGRIFGIEGVRQSNIFSERITSEFLMTDRNRKIWYGNYDTMFCYDPVSGQRHFITGEHKEHINVMYEEGDSIWVGTSRGILYLKNGRLHRVIDFPELGSNLSPRGIYRHVDGQLFFMNCTGAFILNTQTHQVDTIDELRDACVRSIVPFGNRAFVGTYGQGYYIYENGIIHKMPLDKNEYLSEVHSFLFDKKGYVWMSTNNGLFKASIGDIEHYLSDSASAIYYGYFNEKDGIRNSELNGGCFPSSISLANGCFSFPSMDGIVWFDPLKVNDLQPKGPILIDNVMADKMALDAADRIMLPQGVEKLKIVITTPYWGNEENLQLEYMLEDFNSHWIPLLSNENAISFSTLPSGSYNLLIRKKAGYGIGNYITTSIMIHVPPRIYETTAFIVFCSSIAIILFWIGIRLYVSSIRKRTLSLEKKIHERTIELITMNEELMANYRRLKQSEQQIRQSNDLKDQLISIISHDILTPLKFISVVARNFISGKKENDGEKEIIRDIQHTSQRLYDNSQNILNWIKYQNTFISVNKESVAPYSITEDIVELLTDFSTLRKNTIINDVGMDDIVKTDKTIFTIIVQNIVSNAVKYTHSSVIRISSYADAPAGYVIRIADDGPGISESNLRRIQAIRLKPNDNMFNHAGEGTGLGYVIIFDLAHLINASVEVESTPDMGTTVTIILP